MKFRPLHDRVVVKRIDAEEKTAGGITSPDTAKEKPSQGKISPSARAAATKAQADPDRSEGRRHRLLPHLGPPMSGFGVKFAPLRFARFMRAPRRRSAAALTGHLGDDIFPGEHTDQDQKHDADCNNEKEQCAGRPVNRKVHRTFLSSAYPRIS